MTVEYDILLSKIGGFGKYQKLQVILLLFPTIFTAMQLNSLNFILDDHKHRCKIPGNRDYYDRNVTQHPFYNVSSCSLTINGTSKRCTEWVYDQSVMTDSLISSFNLVCKEKTWREHLIMAVFIGFFFGNIGNNFISDLYGRKIVVCFNLLLLAIVKISLPWINNIIVLLMWHFLAGFADVGYYQIAFILATEQVSPKYRVLVNMIQCTMYDIGMFILLLAAYYLRDWHHLVMVWGFPFITTIFHWFFLPESPRWLLAKGRKKDAYKILRKMTEMNDSNFDLKSEEIIIHEELKEPLQKSLKSLFRSTLLVRRLIVLACSFFAVNLSYFGIGLNLGILGGNIYINFGLNTVVETLADTFIFLTLNKFGRKKMHCIALILSGLSCLSTIFPSLYAVNDSQWITIALAMVGKFAVTANFFVVYTYIAELFPTVVRAVAFSICCTTGRIGSISSPYIAALGKYMDTRFGSALPLIIFGTVALASGLASLILPETTSRALPDTAKDAETIGNEYRTHGNIEMNVTIEPELNSL